MKAIQLHISGISGTFAELGKGKYWLFFIPGLVVALLFWQIFLVTETVQNSFSILQNIPFIGSYLHSGVEGTFSVIQFVFNQIFVFFILTVLSPFNTILSEKIDSSITGKKYSFDFVEMLNDLLRMIFVVILSLFLEFFFMLIYWIVSSILGIGFLDQIVYFVIAAFFYGFSFYDYNLERSKIGVFKSLGFAFSNILLVALSGCIFLALYYIPFVGVVIAPVITTIITTIVFLKKKNINLNELAL